MEMKFCWKSFFLRMKSAVGRYTSGTKNMVRARSCFFFCLLVLLFSSIFQAQTRIRRLGYITRLDPPASFLLNQQHVVITPSTKLLRRDPNSGTLDKDPFSIEMAIPGKQVIIQGVEDRQTSIITAKEIEILESGSQLKVEGTAYEDRAPELVQAGSGWQGKVYTDGYEINVIETTQVTLPKNMTDLKSFRPDVLVEYHAVRQPDGSLLAGNIEFSVDDEVGDEQKFRKTSQFKIDPPDYDKSIPGKVRFIYKSAEIIPYFKKTFNIIPNRELQERVDALGQKLVPEWQKALAESDPAKIHFHFYLLQSSKMLNETLSDGAGTVLIPAQILTKLQNEAQLASLLSADVAAAMENDQYRSRIHRHSQSTLDLALASVPFGSVGQLASYAAFGAGYWDPLVKRECRVGLRYLAGAGYDPRQAPLALQRYRSGNPDKAVERELSSLPEYVDMELGFSYAQKDFSNLRTGEAEYAKLLDLLAAADPKMKVPGKTRLADE